MNMGFLRIRSILSGRLQSGMKMSSPYWDMPHISSHILRHTGCNRLGENNVNPKVMQYVMSHSDAQITMNVYNHIAEKSHVENEMSKMNLPETVPAVV